MYIAEEKCFGKVRSAFFPLFPVFWHLTNTSPIGISLINYLFFIISISLLVIYLLKGTKLNMLINFSILITLPSTIIYYIPYTESLFLLTMTIATIGMIKEKYWIYFIGILLMSMVRPATIFVLIAIFAVETLLLHRNKQISLFFKNSLFKAIPFVIGYFISFLFQYLYSGSWTTFLEAQKHWSGGIQRITNISDWSIEGFGMNSFSVFFVAIPAIIFVIFVLATIKVNNVNFLKKTDNYRTDYLFLLSIIYLAGIFLFTLMTSGGNLHSFFRFTLTSPFFYIAALILINCLPNIKTNRIVLFFIVFSFSIFLFLGLINYGGDRFQFSFVGLYLLILSFFYLAIRNILPKTSDIIVFSILVISNVVWNTYIFNIYLCNGWIFT
jgi:hypothetical protein